MLIMHGMHIGRGHIRTRRGWTHSRHHWLRGKSERRGSDYHPSNDIVPDQDSIEGKRKHSCGIAPPAEPSLPRTRVVGSAEGREVRGVANAVGWQEAGPAGCENNVSRYTAKSSLKSRNRQSLKIEPRDGTYRWQKLRQLLCA